MEYDMLIVREQLTHSDWLLAHTTAVITTTMQADKNSWLPLYDSMMKPKIVSKFRIILRWAVEVTDIFVSASEVNIISVVSDLLAKFCLIALF